MFVNAGSRAGKKGGFSSGVTLPFYMAAAPLGWTKLTSQADKAFRVVSSAGGVAGGTNSFSTVMAQSTVGNTTLTTGTIPAHTHSASAATTFTIGSGAVANPNGTAGACTATAAGTSAYWGIATSVTIGTGGGSGGAHNHGITMAMQYIDLILARKN